MRAPFIVLEGIDGSGKSTLARKLSEHFEALGRSVSSYREPGSTPLGEQIRRVLLDPETGDLEPWSEASLFLACRVQLLRRKIAPDLNSGRIVLLDRFYYSSVAYQGYGTKTDARAIESANLSAIGSWLPDRVLLLDLDVGIAAKRRGMDDRMEAKGPEFFERVRQGYLDLAARDPKRFCILDAARPADEILSAALSALSVVLSERR